MHREGSSAFVAAGLLVLAVASANAQWFSGIQTLGGTSSRVLGITSDGSVAAGDSTDGSGVTTAIIWTRAHGIKSLGLVPGATSSTAVGVGIINDQVGGENQVVVAVNSNGAQRWDGLADGTPDPLDTTVNGNPFQFPGGYWTLPLTGGSLEWTVRGLGTNGTSDVWIAGSTTGGGEGGGRKAMRYKQSSASSTSLSLPFGGHDHSDFHAASDNGRFAGQYQHGGSAPSGGARNAMFYVATRAEALNTLAGPPSTTPAAVAKAMSRDGLVEAGWSGTATSSFFHPVIWYATDPVQIDFLPGGDGDNYGEVLALNGDGSVAGGYSYFEAGSGGTDGPREAFLWDAVNGTRSLKTLLTDLGLNLDGWELTEVRALSADGLTIAGLGTHNGNAEGWVAYIGSTPCSTPPQDTDDDGDVDVSDFIVFQACFNGPDNPWADSGDAEKCACLDFAEPADKPGDGDVDIADFILFQACFNGPDQPPAC